MRARRQIPVEEVRTSDEGHDQTGFERSQWLREALRRLPEEQREVLVLRHIAGLSPLEIANGSASPRARSTACTIAAAARSRPHCVELDAAPITA